MSTVNIIMLLTHMGKFMYMQAWLTNSIVICMLGMKVIRHAGVDSRMIILDDQARQ